MPAKRRSPAPASRPRQVPVPPGAVATSGPAPRRRGKAGQPPPDGPPPTPPACPPQASTTPVQVSTGAAAAAPQDARAPAIKPAAPPQKADRAPELDRSEKTSIKLYLQDIGQIPLITPQQEIELAGRIRRGDKAARDHMIRSNLRLVVKIAHDYKDFGLPLIDLISEGNIGLIKAVERFDPSKGGKLSTYAAWWIKQAIKRALANQSKTIRLPVHLVDKISRMRKVAAQLADELERDPTDDELAETMNVPVHKIAHLKTVSSRPASLDAPIGEGEDSTRFGEIVGDENALTPFETLKEKGTRGDLRDLVAALDPREAEILRLRFGLGGEDELTLEEVGRRFRITRERVRQLQNLAISKLRKAISARESQRSAEQLREEEYQRSRQRVLQDFVRNHPRTT